MRVRGASAVALVGLVLAGCGFTPLYGEAGVGSSLSRIAVTTQEDRLGYRVREQLEDALGRDASQPPLWRLQTTVEQSRRPLGRRIDDTATRYELTVRGAWTLTPVGGGLPVSGVETVTTTYAAADRRQGPGPANGEFIAGRRVVDAPAERAARLFEGRLQPPQRRLGAVAAEGVLKLFPHPVSEPVVLRRHRDARQGRTDPALAVQGREAAAGQGRS